MDDVKIYASDHASGHRNDSSAVIASAGPVIVRLSIDRARDIAAQLTRAADDAERKLKDRAAPSATG